MWTHGQQPVWQQAVLRHRASQARAQQAPGQQVEMEEAEGKPKEPRRDEHLLAQSLQHQAHPDQAPLPQNLRALASGHP